MLFRVFLIAGAILAQESFINIAGNATFAYNAADRDGGEKRDERS